MRSSLSSILASGRRCHREGDLDQAKEHYETVIKSDPDNVNALYLLGLVLYRRGDVKSAIDHIHKALISDPEHAFSHASLAQIYQDCGNNEEALKHFGRAIVLHPDNPDLLNGLALSQARAGKLISAKLNFERAIHLRPGMPGLHNNLANLLQSMGEADSARKSYKRCLSLDPDFAEAHNNLGVLYQQQQQPEWAIQQFETAIKIRPDYAAAYNNLGTVLNCCDEIEYALACFQKATHIAPSFVEAVVNRGMAMYQLGQHELARETLDLAHRLVPERLAFSLVRAVCDLDSVYLSKKEIRQARESYEKRLDELADRIDQGGRNLVDQGSALVGSIQPFLLPYQGQDDLKLQKKYGAIVCAMMQKCTKAPIPPSKNGRVRVGLVSAFFYNHSNWKVPIRSWIHHLSRDFDLYGYYTGVREDDLTSEARGLFKRFYSGKSTEQFAKTIEQDGIELLIYPEVGMHPVTTQLAAQRLAPVQCASWGHPVTTGLPTMDYFLSSDLMEPDDADQYYSEKLIRLPGLSFAYATTVEQMSSVAHRKQFGLEENHVVYLCVQNLSKYLPQYDGLLAAIAKRISSSRFVFVEGSKASTKRLKSRLRASFIQAGAAFEEHVVFVHRLNRTQFHALNSVADVFLDTLQWSGCNSTLEAFDCNVPVVTLPGQWMRGRHSYGFYRKMKYEALIANDQEHFVDLAVRLGKDPAWRRIQRQRISEYKCRLYEDSESLNALAAFIRKAAREVS